MINKVDLVALAALINPLPEGQFIDQEWLKLAFETGWPTYASSRGPRAWMVAGVQNNETLVQSRPSVRDSKANFLPDFLRSPTTCTLAAFANTSPRDGQLPKIEVCRFQRWIGIQAEQGTWAAIPKDLWSQLPLFLQRSVRQQSPSEYVFMRFLSFLHADGALGNAYASSEQILKALHHLDQSLQQFSHLHLFVSDGRTLGILQRGMGLQLYHPKIEFRKSRKITQNPQGSAADKKPQALLFLFDATVPPHNDEEADLRIRAIPLADGAFTVPTIPPLLVKSAENLAS